MNTTQSVVLATGVPKRYGTVQESSLFCGLSVRTIRDMLARGELTGFRPRPGRVLISLAELDAMVRRGAKRRGTRGRYQRQSQEAVVKATV